MPRNLDLFMQQALGFNLISPIILVQLTFVSSTQYVWSGLGNIEFGGNVYVGVGSLGKIGNVQEGVEIQADGTSVTLSGIDPTLYGASMEDMKPGAPATIYLGLLGTNGVIIGTPYKLFAGYMDDVSVSTGADTISITLSLESRLVDLARATNRRYTSADQRLAFPSDSAFGWVEQLNDVALKLGIS